MNDAIEAGARAKPIVTDEMVERAKVAWLEHASDYTRLDVSIRAALEAAIASGALVPASAVAVKPLEWEQPDGPEGTAWLGHGTDMGQYYIRFDSETSSYWMPGEEPLYEDDDSAEEFLALDDAKAAAQADYERRIRSALDLAPARGDYVVVPAGPMSDIAAERKRQCEAEGWSSDHDDTHVSGEMAMAAACYTLASFLNTEHALNTTFTRYWPWDRKWWKPKSPRENLVRAAALIVAEIERLDRAMLTAASSQGGGK